MVFFKTPEGIFFILELTGGVFWRCFDVQWGGFHQEGQYGRHSFLVLNWQECQRGFCFSCPQGENGELCLEGAVCEDYYTVRQLLYEQFAII